MRLPFAVMLCCLIVAPARATTQGKKLIDYECNCRDTAFYREHVREMEKMPFDGIVISVLKLKDPDPPDMLGWNTFVRQRFQQKDYQHAIDDLKAVKSRHFTDNFIQIVASLGMDWFDPDWSNMAYNAGCMARVAKQGGCKGLMLDPEQYDKLHMWTYNTLPAELKAAHTFEEYQAKARERGREFIEAVNAEYPDLTILMLFGPSLTHKAAGNEPLKNHEYSLLAAFCDGICEAATLKTTLVDGYEFSYSFKTRKEFAVGRKEIMDSIPKSPDPEALRDHLRAGFGIMPDGENNGVEWQRNDLSKDFFTPAQLRTSVNYALDAADRYAWTYCTRVGWWEGTAPKEYIEALRLARTGPDPKAADAAPLK